MEFPLIIAKILGIYLIVSGLFLLIRSKTLPHLLKDFFGHPATVYLCGVILLFLSTLYLFHYNIWDGTWRSIVTLIVWLTLAKGLLYIFGSHTLEMFVKRDMLRLVKVWGVIAIVAGILLLSVE